MTRSEKLQLLQKVFETGNKSLLKGTNKIIVHSIVVEKDGWLQVVPIEPTFEVSEEMTFEQFQNWRGSLPLFPDLCNLTKKSISE